MERSSYVLLRGYAGHSVRLTRERLDHILNHPEMAGMEMALQDGLADPDRVLESVSDPAVRLYYRHYPETRVGDKLLCVVVKVAGGDEFVITAYLTDKSKRGRLLWQKSE